MVNSRVVRSKGGQFNGGQPRAVLSCDVCLLPHSCLQRTQDSQISQLRTVEIQWLHLRFSDLVPYFDSHWDHLIMKDGSQLMPYAYAYYDKGGTEG